MINLKQGDGNFIINNTYVPKDKITFIITDEYISFQGYYPTIGALGQRYSYDEFTLDGVACESNAQFIDWIQANCFKKKVAFDVYFKGVADTTTEPIMEGGVMYIVLAPATLPNFKDSTGTAITVTQDDLDAGDVYLIGTDGVFDKQVDATREYVDAKVDGVTLDQVAINSAAPLTDYTLLVRAGSGEIRKLTWSYGLVNSSIAQRTSTGTLRASDPTDTTDLTTKSYVDAATKLKPAITALTKIPDPATATTEQVATLLNQLIDALKA